MTEMMDELTPIPVRLDGPSLAALKASAAKCHYDITFNTIKLSTLNPVLPLCNPDLSRVGILVQAFTADAIICETKSKAEDPSNAAPTAAGYPEGYLLAKANTAPTWLPITDGAYVTAGTLPAQVTIALVNKVQG